MSEVDFKAWAAQAARDREAAQVIEKLSGELNRL